MSRGIGVIQKKILVLLLGGLSIGLAGSPKKQLRVLGQMSEELEKIDRDALQKSINSLYRSKLIDIKEKDGRILMVLSSDGKKKVLEAKLEELEIKKPAKWDRHWRIVLFDIPENLKKARETFRDHLRRLGFYQYQKSVFVHPHPCSDELDFLIEFYGIRQHVRMITGNHLDNELHLKSIFQKKSLLDRL